MTRRIRVREREKERTGATRRARALRNRRRDAARRLNGGGIRRRTRQRDVVVHVLIYGNMAGWAQLWWYRPWDVLVRIRRGSDDTSPFHCRSIGDLDRAVPPVKWWVSTSIRRRFLPPIFSRVRNVARTGAVRRLLGAPILNDRIVRPAMRRRPSDSRKIFCVARHVFTIKISFGDSKIRKYLFPRSRTRRSRMIGCHTLA